MKTTQAIFNLIQHIARVGGSLPQTEVSGSYKSIASRATKAGLVEIKGGQYRVTEAGFSAKEP
jgi:hypothetical protein